MLKHPRAKALVDGFATSWLTVRKSSTWQPDLVVHPEFDENLRAAFQRETQLFLESQLGDDRASPISSARTTPSSTSIWRDTTAFPMCMASASAACHSPTA